MKYILVDKETERPISSGDIRRTSKEAEVKVICSTPPHKPSSTGKVYVEEIDTGWKQEFYPSVINAKFVEIK